MWCRCVAKTRRRRLHTDYKLQTADEQHDGRLRGSGHLLLARQTTEDILAKHGGVSQRKFVREGHEQ